MKKKVNLALIGCGAVAEYYHLPVLQRMPEFDIKYLVDSQEERAMYLKDLFRLPASIETTTESILEEEDIEALLILTPPSSHKELITKSAQRKKHLFCEKPLAMNMKETQEILDVCKSNDVQLLVGYQMRFDGKYSKLKEMLKKKMFGKIIGGHGLHFANALKWPSITKFQQDKQKGGGALFEMMHFVDLATWYFGKVISFQSKISTKEKKSPIDDSAYLSLNFENDVHVSLHIGWNRITVNSFTIFGTEGYARALSDSKKIHYHAKDFLAQPPLVIKPKPTISPFHDELLHFYNIIQGKESPITRKDELLQNSKILEKAYLKSSESKLVFLEE